MTPGLVYVWLKKKNVDISCFENEQLSFTAKIYTRKRSTYINVSSFTEFSYFDRTNRNIQKNFGIIIVFHKKILPWILKCSKLLTIKIHRSFFLNSSMKDLIKTTINPGYTGYDSIIS